MSGSPSPQTLAQMLLDAAQKAGADAADAIALSGTSVSVDVREGQLEHAERAEGQDIGLRVFVGQRVASVSGSDASAETIAQMAERAVAMAQEAPEDPHAGLADPAQLARSFDSAALELADPASAPEPALLQSRALAAEEAARAVPDVTQVSGASATTSRTDIGVAATNGLSAELTRTGHSVHCTAIAGTGLGMERDHDGDSRVLFSELRSPEEIGATAGARAVQRVGARKPPTGRYPVLFDERVATSLIGHLLAAINGQAIARGASWLLDGVDGPVLPDGIDLIEDPHRPRVAGSRFFDGEGLPTQRRALVEDGILRGYLLDLSSARKLGLAPTGNAARGVTGGPSPRAWNMTLTQGAARQEALIAQMGTGLLVTYLIGATINPNTGDYSRGAAGHWVENGEIAYPVNQCTIAGNLREMLRSLVPANDARTHLSHVVPSLLVSGLTVAGN